MRRSLLSLILPNVIELGYIGMAAFFIVLLGNGKMLLQKTNLIGGGNLIGEKVVFNATRGLNSLAHFHFTASAVTMLIWGATGLLIYSLLQAITHSLRTMKYSRVFNSNTYVHPQGYAETSFAHHIAVDTITGFGLLLLLATGTLTYLFVVLPASFAYLREFINQPSLGQILLPIMSLAVAFVGTTILFLLLRLVIRHHRLAEFTGY